MVQSFWWQVCFTLCFKVFDGRCFKVTWLKVFDGKCGEIFLQVLRPLERWESQIWKVSKHGTAIFVKFRQNLQLICTKFNLGCQMMWRTRFWKRTAHACLSHHILFCHKILAGLNPRPGFDDLAHACLLHSWTKNNADNGYVNGWSYVYSCT